MLRYQKIKWSFAAICLLLIILAGCGESTTPAPPPEQSGMSAAEFLQTNDDQALLEKFEDATELLYKLAIEDENGQRVELFAHTMAGDNLVKREKLTLVPDGENWVIGEKQQDVLPVLVPRTIDYAATTPQFARDLPEGKEKRFLSFAETFSQVCGWLNFRSPEDLNDMDKYAFFQAAVYDAELVSGSNVEEQYYQKESGAYVIPVSVIRELLSQYLGTSDFDPVAAFGTGGYDLQSDTYTTASFEGPSGSGLMPGLLHFEESGDIITMHVGFYESNQYYNDQPEHHLSSWAEISLRIEAEDFSQYTLLSWVSHMMNEGNTEWIQETPVYYVTEIQKQESNFDYLERVFTEIESGGLKDKSNLYRIPVLENGKLVGSDRFATFLDCAQSGVADAAQYAEIDKEDAALYDGVCAGGEAWTLTKTSYKGPGWYELRTWAMSPVTLNGDVYQIQSLDQTLNFTLQI